MRPQICFALAMGVFVIFAAEPSSAPAGLVLNEWNAVASNRYLAGGSYSDDLTKEDTYWRTIPGMPDGRIEGNGGNWIELVVVEDHLDIRGWELRWAETDATDTVGTDLWYGNASVEQGIITFSLTATLWSDLRRGTMITISEKSSIYVDTDWDGEDRNFTDGLDAADPDVDVTIDLSTDPSYNPMPSDPDHLNADWWIHVSSRGEQSEVNPILTTVTNVSGDGPGDFSVGPADWELAVFNDSGTKVFGPIGEAIDFFGEFPGGINGEEAGRLEADPAADVNNDYYDDVTSTTFGHPNEWGGNVQNFYNLRIPEPITLLLICIGAPLVLRQRRGRRACRAVWSAVQDTIPRS